MGADLIVAGLAVPAGRDIDFEAGRTWVEGATDDEIETETSELFEEEYLESEEVDDLFKQRAQAEGDDEIEAADRALKREQLRRMLSRLEESFSARDTDWIAVPGWQIYMSGGMSWGDNPTDSFQPFQDLGNMPNLCATMGIYAGHNGPAVAKAMQFAVKVALSDPERLLAVLEAEFGAVE